MEIVVQIVVDFVLPLLALLAFAWAITKWVTNYLRYKRLRNFDIAEIERQIQHKDDAYNSQVRKRIAEIKLLRIEIFKTEISFITPFIMMFTPLGRKHTKEVAELNRELERIKNRPIP